MKSGDSLTPPIQQEAIGHQGRVVAVRDLLCFRSLRRSPSTCEETWLIPRQDECCVVMNEFSESFHELINLPSFSSVHR